MRSGGRPGFAGMITMGLVASVLAATLTGCGSESAPEEVTSDPVRTGTGLAGECVPYQDAQTLGDYNAVSLIRSHPALLGADVGASAELSDGRRVWLFGDTVRSADFAGPTWVRNSMIVFGGGCARVALPPDLGAVIPDRPDGVGYWPLSVAAHAVAQGDELVVTATRVRGSATGMDFQTLGGAVARFLVPPDSLPRLLEVVDLGPDAGPADVTWGAALAEGASGADGADGAVLVYGTRWPGGSMVYGRALLVARTTWSGLTDRAAWAYWDGARWQPDPASAAELIGAVGGPSQAVSVFRRGTTWYALSKRDDFLGRFLGIWTAPSPTGPFRLASSWVEIPSDLERAIYVYMPLAHPELPTRPGHVVVSVCVNAVAAGGLAEHPERYRPYFLVVPLPE